jgi:antitoxin PrlF
VSGTPATRRSRLRPVSARARLRPKSQLTLPEDIRRALRVGEGDEVEFRVEENGTITVKGYVSVPTDDAWLFAVHQEEREAPERELPGGQSRGYKSRGYESAEAMFRYLDTLGAADS